MSGIPKNVQNARRGRYNRQTGLKMQGDANRVDLSRMARRAIKRRVHTNFKVKGYDSDYRCDHGIDPNTVSEEVKESYCYNVNQPGNVLLEPAPFHQSAAGGVGHIYYPRRRCNFKCSTDPKPPPEEHCNHVLDLESHIKPIKKIDKAGVTTFDQEFCTLRLTWVRPPVWDTKDKDGKYNYLKVNFLEVKIMIQGSITPIDIGYPTTVNNSYNCKVPLKYNTNYTAEVISHCCCGVGIATIKFPTGPPIPSPLPPSDCSTLSPCNDSDSTYWYGNVVGKPQNHKEDDASYGWGFSFNSSSDYEKDHVKYLNCINNWTFQIFPSEEKPIPENAIKIFQTVTGAKNDNTSGKILNDADFLFFSGIFIYHADDVKVTDNKAIFYSEDPNFKQDTKYDLYINANVNSDTKCSPEQYGPITITTGKNISPPPPPPPTNPCSIINAPFTNWLGTISAGNPINALPYEPQTYGFSIHWDDISKITTKSCISQWKFYYRNKSNSQFSDLLTIDSQSIDKFPRIINFYDEKPSGVIGLFDIVSSGGTELPVVWEIANDGIQLNTEYEIRIEAIPSISTSERIMQEITVKSGKSDCSVDNFIGLIKKTTINSETSNSDAYGFKIDIDDKKIPISNISMLKDYQIDLFTSGTTAPSLFTKTISPLAKIDSFEILKDCSGSTNVANCFEYSDLSQNTQYDVKITGILNNQPISKNLTDLKPNNSYKTDGGSNFFRIKDSLSFDGYHNFDNNFADAPKKIEDITNGKKVSYSFKLSKYTGTIPSGDDQTYPYFRQLWLGLTLNGYTPADVASHIIIEADRNGNKTNTLGPGLSYTGLRGYFYLGVSITYNEDKGTYDILYYNLDISSKTISPEKDPNDSNLYKVTKLNIDTNNLPTFNLEIDAPINGESKVYFNDGTNTHQFTNTLKKGLSDNPNEFALYGSFGSKGVIIENLQFNPLITDCSQPTKTITVTSGKKPSGPSPPAPTPPPKPIYSKDMPQLYFTTYGNSAFKELSKIIQQEDILSSVVNNVNDKQLQLKWYMMRDYNNKYFTQLKNFIVNKDNNIVNYMILMGDYAPILPTTINADKNAIVSTTECDVAEQPTIGYYAGPYALNSVNGPVDFGMSYNVNTPKTSTNPIYTNDTGGNKAKTSFDSVGCPLILDHIIPLAIASKNTGRRSDEVEVTVNADITPNDQAWLTWDAGNYVKQENDPRFPKITYDSNADDYEISFNEWYCNNTDSEGNKQPPLPVQMCYYTIHPDNFKTKSNYTKAVEGSKLYVNKFEVDYSLLTDNNTNINELTLLNIQSGNPVPEQHMFIQFIDEGVSKNRLKVTDKNDSTPLRIVSYNSTTKKVTLNKKLTYTVIASTNKKLFIFCSFYYSLGNVFIGDGSNGELVTSGKRLAPAIGCGRPTHFKPNPDTKKQPTLVDFLHSDPNFYNYGSSNNTDLNEVKYGVNSFPIDNLHQYFITVYFINQKIMELNYYIKQGNLKFASTSGWKEGDLLPLITHVHSDRESASPYGGAEGPYPSCDASGNILKSSFIDSNSSANVGGGLGDPVSVGYWKYLYNKYMPAECLPVWRRDIDHTIHHSTQTKIMNVPATQGTANGIKVPNTSEILWDQNKPWNIDQRRNFHQDASSNLNLGFSITSNDLHSVKKGDATDGIQRYQTGWINTKTTAYLKNCGEGLMEAYQEIYNIGEVKPPLPSNNNSMDDFVSISTSIKTGKLDINYRPKFTLPDKPSDTTKNIIIQNSDYTFGSGIIPGSDFPPNKGNTGNTKGLTPQLAFRLNSIYNPLIGRIASKYGTSDINNYIGATSIKGLEGQSPALSDLWMRQTQGENGPSQPCVPFDGRGFQANINATVDKTTTGVDKSQILNPSKNTDGYYLPIDASFCDLSTGNIDLSDIYDDFTGSALENKNWGTQNSGTPGSGPQEAIATFSFEYMGGATGIDPRLPMPGGADRSSNPWGLESEQYAKFNSSQLAFTGKSRTFATKMYSDMGTSYFKPDALLNVFNNFGQGDYSEAVKTLLGAKGAQQKKMYVLPSCEEPPCKSISGTDLIFSGLSDDTRKTQYDKTDSNGISYGWIPNSNGFGGETNLLSALGVDNFTPMKNFLKASAMCMGGKDNVGKIKVGLYSQEFLPIGWLTDGTEHEI
jgi:hypothetical protein